jgi:hypothetical protein
MREWRKPADHAAGDSIRVWPEHKDTFALEKTRRNQKISVWLSQSQFVSDNLKKARFFSQWFSYGSVQAQKGTVCLNPSRFVSNNLKKAQFVSLWLTFGSVQAQKGTELEIPLFA